MIKKTLLTSLFLLCLVFPIAKSFAVVPALLLFVAPAAESTFVPWAAGIAAAGVSALAAWIMMQDPAQPAQKPITVQIDPNTPLITPPGWNNPTTPPSTAGTPTTTLTNDPNEVQYYQNTYAQTVANAQTSNFGYPVTCSTEIIGKQAKVYCDFSAGGGSNRVLSASQNISQVATTTCPSGYITNGSTCILDNPADVKKPPKGKDEIKRNGNNFARDPQQDPSDNNPKVQVSGNQLSYTNDQGEKIVIALNATTGGATVTHSVPDSATGTTKASSTDLSPNGTPTGSSQQTYQGTGTQQTTTPSSGVTFPNDYARAGEANTAAQKIVDKLDPLTSQTGAADGSAETPTFTDGFGPTFAPLSGWQLPSHQSTCPTAQFSIWSHQFNLNSQCTVFNDVKAPLSYAMIAAWVIAGLLIVLGA